jgi:hypothetical protein
LEQVLNLLAFYQKNKCKVKSRVQGFSVISRAEF